MRWTRDGTYLRLRDDQTNAKDLEFPDGTIYRFELRPQPLFGGGTQETWLLVSMKNRFPGNSVSVDYQRDAAQDILKWVVTDSHQRRQEVVFERDTSGNPTGRARLVRLSAPHAQTAEWKLVYADDSIVRCHDTWEGSSNAVSVSLLTQVIAPTSVSTGFVMTYNLASQTPGVCYQGLISRLALPTAGTAATACNGAPHCAGIEWTYGDYQLPTAACDGRVHFTITPGVVEKRTFDATGAASFAGKWTFKPVLGTVGTPRSVQCPDRDFPNQAAIERFYTFTNTVTTPLEDQTVHHFSVLPRPNYEWFAPPAIADRWEEYGLPLTRSTSISGSDGKALFLSAEIQDCAGAACTTLANKYVRYERDASLFLLDAFDSDRYDLQRRLATERIVHLPGQAGEHWIETRREDFDGAGHYRTITEIGGGWSLAGTPRTTTTTYNSGNGTYSLDDNGQTVPGQHSYTSLAEVPTWRLDTFATVARTQGGSAEEEQACFAQKTAALDRRRVFANGTSAGTHDVIVVYARNGDGNVTSETFYGGDKSLVPTDDVCAKTFAFPAAAYSTKRSYNGGLPASMEWMDGSTSVLRRYLAAIDVNGARVVSATEPDGIRTDYGYDVLGRLQTVMPGKDQTGKFSAWTQFTYGTAATTGCSSGNPDDCASLLVERFDPGSFAGTPLSRHRYTFDGLGRMIRDGIRVPDTTLWSDIVTKYDGMGHVASRSERHTVPTSLTTFSGFDALDRPALITPPAGGAQAIELTYAGVKAETQTTQVARFASPFPSNANNSPLPAIAERNTARTTHFDAMHRLVRLVDDSNGLTAEQLTTDYGYDVGGRLTTVRMGGPGTVLQARDFAYDALGRLRSEDHPELAHESGSGNFCGNQGGRAHDVIYDSYDVLGNLLRKCDDEVDLVFKYDRAQRLTQVRLAGATPNLDCTSEVGTCLQRFSYGGGTTPGNRSNGKVTQASSFNYRRDTAPPISPGQPPRPLFVAAELIYDYQYDGAVAVDGGLSSRILRFNASTSATQAPQPATERFTQSFSYTPLGALARVDYPACDFAPCNVVGVPPRSIGLSYTEGLLTAITDLLPPIANYASVTYWPHPMVRRVTFADGKIWQQDPDLQNQPRPRNICAPAPGSPPSDGCGTGGLGTYTYDGEGNVKSIGGSLYAYDAYSRVVYGQMGSGEYQRYGYDLFGNIQKKWLGQVSTNAGGVRLATDIQSWDSPTTAATNRMAGAGYDQRGTMNSWNGNTYAHDELNRLGVVHIGNKVRWYFYDIDGERVLTFEPPEFAPNGQATFDWTLRGLDGKALRSLRLAPVNGSYTWSWLKDYVYRDGTALAYETPAGRGIYMNDHLGTPRIVWAESGAVTGHHYYPFGEEAFFQPGDAEALKFTGHERDLLDFSLPADDLDYMHARYYNQQLGRFLSTDSLSGVTSAPQSWNRYSYVLSNPLFFVDPDGRLEMSFTNFMLWASQGFLFETISVRASSIYLDLNVSDVRGEPLQHLKNNLHYVAGVRNFLGCLGQKGGGGAESREWLGLITANPNGGLDYSATSGDHASAPAGGLTRPFLLGVAHSHPSKGPSGFVSRSADVRRANQTTGMGGRVPHYIVNPRTGVVRYQLGVDVIPGTRVLDTGFDGRLDDVCADVD